MAHYHLVHLYPSDRNPQLQSSAESIEALTWGLEHLGHQVTSARNSFVTGARNIILGHHVAGVDILELMPADSIVYNLSPLKVDLPLAEDSPLAYVARHFTIWDYNNQNIEIWQKIGTTHPVVRIPVGFAPILCRLPKPDRQDIDILICGFPGENRIKALQGLCSQGLRIVFLHGFYGKARDDLIARSRIVLLVGETGEPFDIKMATYLLANRKAVIADLYDDIIIESDLANSIMFVGFDYLVSACLHVLEHEDARVKMENMGFLMIHQRAVLPYLQAVVGEAESADE